MSAAQTAMNVLTAQWYNAVAVGCGLDKGEFQLVQGADPVGSLSENLWAIFDSVPPLSATTYYNPAQLNSFSQDYAGVISALIPQGALQFQTDMGDYYAAWNSYKSTISPIPASTLAWSQAFAAWAEARLPESQVSTCRGDFNSMQEDPIAVASNQLLAVQFAASHANVYAYTTTVGQLALALAKAVPKTVQLDSSTESSDVSHSWASAEASGIFDIFGIGGDGSYDDITTKVTTAGVSVQASFGKLVTLTAGPLSQPSSDTYLQNFTPWFSSAALSEGYAKQDNTVWKSGDAISWASTFGPSGNLQRYTSALIIVDGITLTMTSQAGLSNAEQQQFQQAAAGGIFPFFEAEEKSGWSNESTFDDKGNVTVTCSCPAGNPQILGVLVSQIADIL